MNRFRRGTCGAPHTVPWVCKMSGFAQIRCRCGGLRWRHLVAFASVMLVAFCSIGTHQAHAQNDPEPWTGTVEVSPATLTLRPGQTLRYRIRLTEQPTADGWWVRLFVDGEVRADGAYEGFSWVPSVGWGFDRDNWDQWRGINIRTADDLEAGTQVVFTHEVWDHTAECPVHNASPVRVNVIHNSSSPSLPEMNYRRCDAIGEWRERGVQGTSEQAERRDGDGRVRDGGRDG